jgi:uncharacterized membrane protein YgdD (TMEM256/DUF423 family)
MHNRIIVWAAVFLFLAVALGAFGAHALRTRLEPDMMQAFQTGVQYHFYHALGLLLVGVVALNNPSRRIGLSALFLALGIILFSGSLYVMATTGIKGLGIITPFGGVSFLTGWAMLLAAVLKKQTPTV